MDITTLVGFVGGIVALVASFMSAEGWPKAQHKLVVLAAFLFAHAIVPLSHTSLTPLWLTVSQDHMSEAKILVALIVALLVWWWIPVRGPETLAEVKMVRGKAVISVTNSGRTSGRFYAVAVTPWPDPSKAKPYDLHWGGGARFSDLERGQSDEVWIGYVTQEKEETTGDPVDVLIMPTPNRVDQNWQSKSYWIGAPEGYRLPRAEDSTRLFLVEIRTTPETCPPWRCRIILDWSGGQRLGIQSADLQSTELEQWERRLKMNLGWLRSSRVTRFVRSRQNGA